MPTQQMIEMTLMVSTADEGVAAKVAEILARAALGVSAEANVHVTTGIERYEMVCHHDHDEVGP